MISAYFERHSWRPCNTWQNKFGIKLKLCFCRFQNFCRHISMTVDFFRYFAVQKIWPKNILNSPLTFQNRKLSSSATENRFWDKMSGFFCMLSLKTLVEFIWADIEWFKVNMSVDMVATISYSLWTILAEFRSYIKCVVI